jgi:hypothetical protein
MPIEYLHGRPLKPEEIRVVRVALEHLRSVQTNDPRIRALVARNSLTCFRSCRGLVAQHLPAALLSHFVGDAPQRQLHKLEYCYDQRMACRPHSQCLIDERRDAAPELVQPPAAAAELATTP